jgi:prepilin signal peptidase PulO-like enzyme (type II secretory pathway)
MQGFIWPALLVAGYFGLVAVIDIEHRLVLHPVSLVGAVLGAAVGVGLHGIGRTLAGGAAGFALMLALYWFGGVFAKWMARRRGEAIDEVALGFGDVNLAGICGLMLGWPGVFAGLVAGILLGGLASLIVIALQMIRKSYTPFTAIPYAPFLIIGTVILLIQSLKNYLSQ